MQPKKWLLFFLQMSLSFAQQKDALCRSLSGSISPCGTHYLIAIDASHYLENASKAQAMLSFVADTLMPMYFDGGTQFSFALYGTQDTALTCQGYITNGQASPSQICVALAQMSAELNKGVLGHISLQNITHDIVSCAQLRESRNYDFLLLFTANNNITDIFYASGISRLVQTVVVNYGTGDFRSWVDEGASVICAHDFSSSLAERIANLCGMQINDCFTSSAQDTTPSYTTSGVPDDRTNLCKGNIANSWNDIVIVVDTSSAMGSNNFNQLQSFLKAALYPATIGQQFQHNTRVGVVTYSNQVQQIASLTKYSNSDAFFDDDWPYTPSDDTNIVGGIDAARSMLFGSGHRPKSRPVIILGASTYRESQSYQFPMNETLTFKRNFGVVIVIAFGDVNGVGAEVLRELASPGYYIDASKGHTPLFSDFRDLITNANCFCPGQQTDGYFPVQNPGESWPSLGCYWDSHIPGIQKSATKVCAELSDAAGIPFMPKTQFQQQAVLAGAMYNITRPSFYIGLHQKSGYWIWDDGTSYTGDNIPSGSGTCAIVKQGQGFSTIIASSDCFAEAYYGCQTMPCSADNYCD